MEELDLTDEAGLQRARVRLAGTGRPLGVAVRRGWIDRREGPRHGDGVSVRVVITDGVTDYTPQTPVYIMRETQLDAAGLEDELEQIAIERWGTDSAAARLANEVQGDRLIIWLEDFGLGSVRTGRRECDRP